jgi:hypothetical protein
LPGTNPTADLHHHARVDFLVDEEPLSKPSPEIVTRHRTKVFVTVAVAAA